MPTNPAAAHKKNATYLNFTHFFSKLATYFSNSDKMASILIVMSGVLLPIKPGHHVETFFPGFDPHVWHFNYTNANKRKLLTWAVAKDLFSHIWWWDRNFFILLEKHSMRLIQEVEGRRDTHAWLKWTFHLAHGELWLAYWRTGGRLLVIQWWLAFFLTL